MGDVLPGLLLGVYLSGLGYGLWSLADDYRKRKRGVLVGGQHVRWDLALWVVWPMLVALSPVLRPIYRWWNDRQWRRSQPGGPSGE